MSFRHPTSPGGRGQRTGRQAYTQQNEADVVRSALLPATNGLVVGTLGLPFNCSATGSSTLTGGTGRFHFIGRTEVECTVVESRIRVSTAAAGTTIETALYIYNGGVLRAIPGTRAVYDSTGTGVKTVTLKQPVTVSAGILLMVGVLAIGGNPAITATPITSTLYCNTKIRVGLSALPGELALSACTDTGVGLAHVLYLSSEAAALI